MLTDNFIWTIEDELDEKNIFVNGLDNKPAHRDSYLTVMNIPNLELWYNANKNKYSKETWLELAENWIGFNYISPMSGLLGTMIKQWVGDVIK